MYIFFNMRRKVAKSSIMQTLPPKLKRKQLWEIVYMATSSIFILQKNKIEVTF